MKIPSNPNVNNTYKNLSNDYRKMSSGKKVQRAADGPVELAISQKLQAKYKALNVQASNIRNDQLQINIKDGRAAGDMESLQRMNELSVRAANGLWSDSDRRAMTTEQNAMASSLQSVELPKSMNIDDISASMDSLSAERSKDGAKYNGLEHAYHSAQITAENLVAADSRLTDLEYGAAAAKKSADETLLQTSIHIQKQTMANAGNILNLFT